MHVFSLAESLRQSLQPYFAVQVELVGDQPDMNYSFQKTLIASTLLWKAQVIHHFTANNRSFRKAGTHSLVLLLTLLKSILPGCFGGGLRDTAHRKWVEYMLTKKHRRLWELALRQSADYLLVLEDDAIGDPTSAMRLKSLMQGLQPTNDAILWNLSEGYAVDSTQQMVSKYDGVQISEDFYELKIPVSNTTCAYLLSQRLVSELVGFLDGKTAYERLPVDWLINEVLRKSPKDLKTKVFHAVPAYFSHGSLHTYKSSIRI